jgi:hypothetical protein
LFEGLGPNTGAPFDAFEDHVSTSCVRFFIGLHQPSDARNFQAVFISVIRLRSRKARFDVGDWIMDSGAFTEISRHGRYRHDVEHYAAEIRRWAANGRLLARYRRTGCARNRS